MPLTTKQKMFIGRLAQAPILWARRLAGLGATAEVRRAGLNWRLDLNEGIDFAIYILRRFDNATMRLIERQIAPGAVALDIAANPDLAGRVTAEQIMLVERVGATPKPTLYAGWPLDSRDRQHAKHGGRAMATDGARAMTLDEYLDAAGVARLDFIKLDVDGHEYPVLRGARRTLARFAPKLVIEVAPYVHEEYGHGAEDFLGLLRDAGYRLIDEKSGRPLPGDFAALSALAPDSAGINVLARRG